MDSPNTSADYFADSSIETVTPNENLKISSGPMETDDNLEPYPPAPVIDSNLEQSLISADTSLLVNEFVNQSNLPTRICCPFCIFDFGYEVLLKDHIKQSHGRELTTVLQSASGEVDFHQCPFCSAKFYHKELLPKHIIRKHEICVVNMFSGFSPEKYVYCRFCPHKILRKHYKLLMIHIEKKHYSLFEKYIIAKYSNLTQSIEDLLNLDSCETNKYDSPGLSGDLLKLTTEETETTQSPSFKSILKPKTAYPLDQSECLSNKEENMMYANLSLPQKNFRRKLRFNLPNSTEEDNNEDDVPSKKKKKVGNKEKTSLKWSFSSQKNKNKSPSKSNVDAENKENTTDNNTELAVQICRFKCGLCSEAFDVNSKLVEHVKKKHRGLKFQAQYRCGECQAKFYRNSYLVKHCWHNHGPLCLKTPICKKDTTIKF